MLSHCPTCSGQRHGRDPGRLGDRLGRDLAGVGLAAGDHDGGPRLGETERDRVAEPPGGAGDQGDPADEAGHDR